MSDETLLSDVETALQQRAEHIDRWLALAVRQPDPAKWVRALIQKAVARLDRADHTEQSKQLALKELHAIQRDLLAAVKRRT